MNALIGYFINKKTTDSIVLIKTLTLADLLWFSAFFFAKFRSQFELKIYICKFLFFRTIYLINKFISGEDSRGSGEDGVGATGAVDGVVHGEDMEVAMEIIMAEQIWTMFRFMTSICENDHKKPLLD